MTRITPALIANIRRVGVDLAKSVIQVHAVDGAGLGGTARRDAENLFRDKVSPVLVLALSRMKPVTRHLTCLRPGQGYESDVPMLFAQRLQG